VRGRVLPALALAATLAVALAIVVAQPVRSLWWTYADADATYTAASLNLLLGAARLNYRIVDVPVRYQPRTYGSTNISRWRHGWLLARMTAFAFWKFRVAPMRSGRRR
jgi:hypothetical protein